MTNREALIHENGLNDALLQKERDAAIEKLGINYKHCRYCKNYDLHVRECKSKPNPGKCWEWRGI